MNKSTSSVAWDPAVILGSNESTLSVWHDGKAAVHLLVNIPSGRVFSLSRNSKSCTWNPAAVTGANHVQIIFLYLGFYFSAYMKWQFNATEYAFSCRRADFGSFMALLLQEGVRVEKFAVQLHLPDCG